MNPSREPLRRCGAATTSAALLLVVGLASACGDDSTAADGGETATESSTGSTSATTTSSGTVGSTSAASTTSPSGSESSTTAMGTGSSEGSSSGSEGSSSTGTSEPTAVRLPQAVAGMLWANPAVYTEVPLHVAVDGGADTVTVALGDGRPVEAAFDVAMDEWIAMVNIGMGPSQTVTAVASGNGVELQATAELSTGNQGLKFTDVDDDGPTNNPTLHRVDDTVLLSWTDDSAAERAAYLVQVDGTANRLGDPVRLTPVGEDAFLARVAVGSDAAAVLYSVPDTPFLNYLTVVDLDGTVLLPSVALETGSEAGSNGAAIAYDGDGFVAVWKVQGGTGTPRIRWIRVDETDWSTTGPVTVTDETPGDIPAFSFIDLEVVDGRSAVSFTRYRNVMTVAVLKAQLAVVNPDGTLEDEQFFGSGDDFFWHHEVHLSRVDGEAVAVWSADDLTDPSIPIPTQFHAVGLDGTALDNGPGPLTVTLSGEDDFRGEPALVDTDPGFGVMAWTDNRANNTPGGNIALWAAPVADDLTATGDVPFLHARFIEGTSHLRGISAGSNALIVWIDQRDGGSLVNPRPEIYLETIWQ